MVVTLVSETSPRNGVRVRVSPSAQAAKKTLSRVGVSLLPGDTSGAGITVDVMGPGFEPQREYKTKFFVIFRIWAW